MIDAMPPDAVPQSRASRGARPALRFATLPRGLVRLGVLLAAVAAAEGCGGGYREKVIPAKEFTPLERARQMLERYAKGEPVGSDFMGFELLKEELASTSPERAAVIGEALTAIEKAMRRPAEVQAIARKTLAELDKPAAARE